MSDLYSFLGAQQNSQHLQQQARNNRVQDQEIQRRNEFQAESQNLSRISQIMDILKLGGQPVNANGAVATNLQPYQQQEAANAGVIGLQQFDQEADPARTVAVGGNRYMLPTQNDIFQQALNQKRIASQQALDEYGQRQRIDDASSLDRSKQLFDYQNSERQKLLAQQPMFDPSNPTGSKVPMDNLSGFAQAMGILFPEFKALNNYGTNDTTMTRVNRVNGKLETRVVKDAVGSRPRNSATGRGDAFDKIEQMKQRDLQAAEQQFSQTGDSEALAKAKTAAQNDYEKAIIRAGGRIAPRKANGQQKPAQAPSAPSGKMTAEQYLQSLNK